MIPTSNQLVTVFGGSGFVGRHVVRALARRGYRIRVAVRRPDLALFLQPLGRVGQIHPVQANVRYPASIAAALEGADAAVNLVGILNPSGAQTFEAVQAQGARAVAEAARQAGITRYVQMSALGADPESDSVYARTKAAGEAAAMEAVPTAVVMRPSIVFGPEDSFFNRFAALARMSPVIPLIGGGETRFQPVFVGDVAEAICRVMDATVRTGVTYELGGPEVKTFRQLIQYVLDVTGRRRLLVAMPVGAARVQAAVTEFVNKVTGGLVPDSLMLTGDQVRLLQVDNVVSDAAIAEGRTLEAMGVTPEIIEAVVPAYLYRFRARGQFDAGKFA
ncbi:complex I NDUFA9 subunit family protein [Alsobacter sp. SYSU BS001988]|jgi:NADH dehydrogenase